MWHVTCPIIAIYFVFVGHCEGKTVVCGIEKDSHTQYYIVLLDVEPDYVVDYILFCQWLYSSSRVIL